MATKAKKACKLGGGWDWVLGILWVFHQSICITGYQFRELHCEQVSNQELFSLNFHPLYKPPYNLHPTCSAQEGQVPQEGEGSQEGRVAEEGHQGPQGPQVAQEDRQEEPREEGAKVESEEEGDQGINTLFCIF